MIFFCLKFKKFGWESRSFSQQFLSKTDLFVVFDAFFPKDQFLDILNRSPGAHGLHNASYNSPGTDWGTTGHIGAPELQINPKSQMKIHAKFIVLIISVRR